MEIRLSAERGRRVILSHKYKFFFLRARKVAGSSILYSLGKHCDGKKDIVNSPDTAIAKCNRIHGTNYPSIKRNFQKIDPKYEWGESDFPRIHIAPSELKCRFPKEWETYAKIGAVRNPFDMIYSMYAFEQVLKPNRYNADLGFNEWINHKGVYMNGGLGKERISSEFWFEHDTGLPIEYDFMIKYENLENDYKNVCEHFGIPYEPLLRLNSSTRFNAEDLAKYKDLYGATKDTNANTNRSYREHYNDQSREYIGNLYAKLIERYDYEF